MGSSKRLNDYIKEVRHKPFEWGEHDCFIFSNTAFKCYHGFGYADDWIGRYMGSDGPMLPSRLRKEFSVSNFDEAIEQKLKRVEYVPPKGSLVATKKAERWAVGYALGISLGIKAAFLSRGGLIFIPIDDIDKAWIPTDE